MGIISIPEGFNTPENERLLQKLLETDTDDMELKPPTMETMDKISGYRKEIEAEDIIKALNRLIGSTYAVGETWQDQVNWHNLDNLIKVTDWCTDSLILTSDTWDSAYYSMQLIGEKAKKALEDCIRKLNSAVEPYASWESKLDDAGNERFVCSVCGEEPWWCGVEEAILPDYCPHCGVKML